MPSTAPRLRLVDRSIPMLRMFGANRSPATSVAVCIPARNEAATIGAIVSSVARLREAPSLKSTSAASNLLWLSV